MSQFQNLTLCLAQTSLSSQSLRENFNFVNFVDFVRDKIHGFEITSYGINNEWKRFLTSVTYHPGHKTYPQIKKPAARKKYELATDFSAPGMTHFNVRLRMSLCPWLASGQWINNTSSAHRKHMFASLFDNDLSMNTITIPFK